MRGLFKFIVKLFRNSSLHSVMDKSSSAKALVTLSFDDGYTVVLFEPQNPSDVGRSIKGYLNDREIWQIQPDSLNDRFNYVSIRKETGNLIAVNFSTSQYEIDYTDGTVVSSRWLK